MNQNKSKIIPCNNCGSFDCYPLVAFKDGEGGDAFGSRFTAVVCKECSLCFLNPQPPAGDYLKYYREKGETSPGNPLTSKDVILARKRHHKLYADWLDRNAGLSKQANIVDMGCGLGTLLYYLGELGYKNLLGVEASKRACEVAGNLLQVNVLNQDALVGSLPPESFDMLTGVAFIEHLTDPLQSLKEMASLIKLGGLIYLNTHDLKGLTLRKGFTSFFKFVHAYYFTELTLTSLLEQAGFRVVGSRSVPPLTGRSNLIFPENCFHGELNILAEKTGAPAGGPLKEDYKVILDSYRAAKYRDWPYALSAGLIFSRWGRPLRIIRRRMFSGFKRDARELKFDFFSEEGKKISIGP